ncbi:MAG: TolC family protein [Polyangiaceae bacterium]|nr:TolC family protein [Polyangiaceae bacterium]
MSVRRLAAALLLSGSPACQAAREPIVPTPPEVTRALYAPDPAPAAASELPSGALDCATIRERALALSPEVGARAARVREKVALARAAGAQPPPMVMTQLWEAPLHKPFVYGDGSMLMLGISQTFVPRGAREGEARAMLAEASGAAAEASAAALDVRAEVDRGCAELAEARARVALLDRRAKLLDGVAEVARARLATGASGAADVARVELERARVDGDRAELGAREVEARAALNAQIDRAPDAEITVDGAEDEPPLEPVATLTQRAAAERPEGAVRSAMIARDLARADAARSMARTPMITVGINYGLSRPSGMPDTWGATLSMSLPWLSGGAAATEEAARHAAVAAAREGDGQTRSRRREVIEAHTRAVGLATRLQTLTTRALPAARRAAEAVRATYAGGGSDLSAWLDALRAEVELDEQATTLRAELARARIALDKAVGRTPRAASDRRQP